MAVMQAWSEWVNNETRERRVFLDALEKALPELSVYDLSPGRMADGSGVWNLMLKRGSALYSLQAVFKPGQELCDEATLVELTVRVRHYFRKRDAGLSK